MTYKHPQPKGQGSLPLEDKWLCLFLSFGAWSSAKHLLYIHSSPPEDEPGDEAQEASAQAHMMAFSNSGAGVHFQLVFDTCQCVKMEPPRIQSFVSLYAFFSTPFLSSVNGLNTPDQESR